MRSQKVPSLLPLTNQLYFDTTLLVYLGQNLTMLFLHLGRMKEPSPAMETLLLLLRLETGIWRGTEMMRSSNPNYPLSVDYNELLCL